MSSNSDDSRSDRRDLVLHSLTSPGQLSPDQEPGRFISLLTIDGRISTYDVHNGDLVDTIDTGRPLLSVTPSPAQASLEAFPVTLAPNGDIYTFNMSTGLPQLVKTNFNVDSVALSPSVVLSLPDGRIAELKASQASEIVHNRYNLPLTVTTTYLEVCTDSCLELVLRVPRLAGKAIFDKGLAAVPPPRHAPSQHTLPPAPSAPLSAPPSAPPHDLPRPHEDGADSSSVFLYTSQGPAFCLAASAGRLTCAPLPDLVAGAWSLVAGTAPTPVQVTAMVTDSALTGNYLVHAVPDRGTTSYTPDQALSTLLREGQGQAVLLPGTRVLAAAAAPAAWPTPIGGYGAPLACPVKHSPYGPAPADPASVLAAAARGRTEGVPSMAVGAPQAAALVGCGVGVVNGLCGNLPVFDGSVLVPGSVPVFTSLNTPSLPVTPSPPPGLPAPLPLPLPPPSPAQPATTHAINLGFVLIGVLVAVLVTTVFPVAKSWLDRGRQALQRLTPQQPPAKRAKTDNDSARAAADAAAAAAVAGNLCSDIIAFIDGVELDATTAPAGTRAFYETVGTSVSELRVEERRLSTFAAAAADHASGIRRRRPVPPPPTNQCPLPYRVASIIVLPSLVLGTGARGTAVFGAICDGRPAAVKKVPMIHSHASLDTIPDLPGLRGGRFAADAAAEVAALRRAEEAGAVRLRGHATDGAHMYIAMDLLDGSIADAGARAAATAAAAVARPPAPGGAPAPAPRTRAGALRATSSLAPVPAVAPVATPVLPFTTPPPCHTLLGHARIGQTLFAAAAELHNSGLVHLDIKPQNILLRLPRLPALARLTCDAPQPPAKRPSVSDVVESESESDYRPGSADDAVTTHRKVASTSNRSEDDAVVQRRKRSSSVDIVRGAGVVSGLTFTPTAPTQPPTAAAAAVAAAATAWQKMDFDARVAFLSTAVSDVSHHAPSPKTINAAAVAAGFTHNGPELCLADLGSARTVLSATATAYQPQPGTAGWAPPELARPGTRVTSAADVYAAGLVVAWLLAADVTNTTDTTCMHGPAAVAAAHAAAIRVAGLPPVAAQAVAAVAAVDSTGERLQRAAAAFCTSSSSDTPVSTNTYYLNSLLLADLFARCLSASPAARPFAAAAAVHPFFWSPASRLDLICELSDELESRPANDPLVIRFEERASEAGVVGRVPEAADESELRRRGPFLEAAPSNSTGGWFASLSPAVRSALGSFRKYSTHSTRDLIRLIRNKSHHFRDLPAVARFELAPPPAGYLAYFERRWPALVLVCWEFAVHEDMCRQLITHPQLL